MNLKEALDKPNFYPLEYPSRFYFEDFVSYDPKTFIVYNRYLKYTCDLTNKILDLYLINDDNFDRFRGLQLNKIIIHKDCVEYSNRGILEEFILQAAFPSLYFNKGIVKFDKGSFSIIYNPATGLFEEDFSDYSKFGYHTEEEFKKAYETSVGYSAEEKHVCSFKAYVGFTEKYDWCECGIKQEYSGENT